ncbi:MAG: DEAD/DEAH box helicase [Elusimicrobiota bacterium]|nr:MAG: DEAD/DEAH box helicase [Elusimicrobiota bacterium]
MSANILPITAHRERILSELNRAGALILSAPTGSGKSTQTAQFLLGKTKGRILVLEPRRLSARSLAARVAAETKTRLGERVGYQVRFDSRSGPKTEIVFQTYGIFVAQMMKDPELPGVGAVLLDEFHERSLECDLALAWLKRLRVKRPELKLVVMSATLGQEALAKYLPGAAKVEVPGRMFPVDVRYRVPDARSGPAENALGALKDLIKQGLDGSVLVFMPGLREIRRSLTVLGPVCREHGIELLGLHGSMEPEEQDRALAPTGKPRVIVATNVAETGLTIPDVTAVIDSGLHRVAAHDAARGINTLYVARISRANAAQRAGRAGRTAPGRCVRLWTLNEEAAMAESLKPEIARLELSSLRLQAASLPESVDWLTPHRSLPGRRPARRSRRSAPRRRGARPPWAGPCCATPRRRRSPPRSRPRAKSAPKLTSAPARWPPSSRPPATAVPTRPPTWPSSPPTCSRARAATSTGRPSRRSSSSSASAARTPPRSPAASTASGSTRSSTGSPRAKATAPSTAWPTGAGRPCPSRRRRRRRSSWRSTCASAPAAARRARPA